MQVKAETHILDYNADIYNEIVQVEFYDFIRPERTFESVEELKAQIEKDIEACREKQEIYFKKYDCVQEEICTQSFIMSWRFREKFCILSAVYHL